MGVNRLVIINLHKCLRFGLLANTGFYLFTYLLTYLAFSVMQSIIAIQGHPRSLISVPIKLHVWLLLVINCHLGLIVHRFRDFLWPIGQKSPLFLIKSYLTSSL